MKLRSACSSKRLYGMLTILALSLIMSLVDLGDKPGDTVAQGLSETVPQGLAPANASELVRALTSDERTRIIQQLLAERRTFPTAPPRDWHPLRARMINESNGSIAFVNPNGELWLIDSDGGNLRPVTGDSPLMVPSPPAWSPDGKYLAFAARDEGGITHLHIVSSEGTHQDGQTFPRPFAEIYNLIWSPDGQHIAFNGREAEDIQGTYVVNVNTRDLARLAHDDTYLDRHGFGITWSPDGQWIAFTLRKSNGRWSVFKARPNGSGLKELAALGGEFSCENQCVNCSNDPDFALSPAWSPDGTQIAFLAGRARRVEDELDPKCVTLFDIYVADPRGAVQPWPLVREIVNSENPVGGASAWHALWSPDNVTLALVGRAGDGKMHLYTVDVPNRHTRQLDCKRSGDLWFDWSPDGTRMAASFAEGEAQDLHVVFPGTDQCSDKLADGRWPAWKAATGFVGWRGEYYNGRDFDNDDLIFVRDDWTIAFNWGDSAPEHQGVATYSDDFSVRWTKILTFTEATYTFRVTADDSVRLSIDETSVIDTWDNPSPNTELTADVALTSGEHIIRLEYYEATENAKVALTWDPFLELPMGYDCNQWQENAFLHFGGTDEAFRIAVLARNNNRPEGGNACQQDVDGELRPRETRRINSYFDHQYPTYDETHGQVVLYDGSLQDVSYNGHDGYDFNTFFPPGDMMTPVFAAAGGIVASESENRFRDGEECPRCLGNHVVLVHPNGYMTVYGHLRQNSGLENLHLGQWIDAGHRIGLMDDTGRSDDSHLHFVVYLDQDGDHNCDDRDEKVDPFGFTPREGADYTEDPWVRDMNGPVSRYLWIHPLRRDELLNPSQRTVLTSPDGNLTVDIPARAVASKTTLRYLALPDHRSTAWLAGTGHTFALTLIDPGGDFIPGFELPVSVTIHYTDLNIHNIDETTLALFRWAGESEGWQASPTTLDQETYSAVSQIISPGKFALLGVPIRDEVPPITSITVEGETMDQPDWYVGPVTVTLAADDNVGGIGVAQTMYSVNGGASWQLYGGPFVIAQPGVAYIAAQSQDFEGNLEEPPAAVQATILTRAYLPVILK